MSDAATNSPFVGESDSGRPALTIDDAANLDFAEPGEANEQEEEEGQSTNATDETIEGQEAGDPADNAESEETADPEDGEGSNAAQDTIVTLKGGEQVPLEELKLGYMRDRDYRHKTQEIGNRGRTLDAMTTRVANTVKGIASYLADRLPAEPHRSLAVQNPTEYTRQKAMYDEGLANINQIIELANDSTAVADELASSATQETLQAESEKLAQVFPETTKDEGRKAFFDQAFTAARELGFSESELKTVTDHRLFGLAYYAEIGMKAEQARRKALTKVTAAPPATPNPRSNGAANQQVRQSRDAMQRLSKSGSMKDAMSIDFD